MFYHLQLFASKTNEILTSKKRISYEKTGTISWRFSRTHLVKTGIKAKKIKTMIHPHNTRI
ncbi:MAG: hypothetical protein LBV42_03485 [Methanobrevibacter sp.]|jgi:hypothetical protein|nr:hypothetical protein [Methanobrevibacter sp.]